MNLSARLLACSLLLAAAPTFATTTTTGVCSYDTEQHYVFVCDSGTRGSLQGIGDPAGSQHPYCSAGTWRLQTIVTGETCEDRTAIDTFDPSTLDGQTLANAFGAGFIVMGTGLVLAWAVRMIIATVRHW